MLLGSPPDMVRGAPPYRTRPPAYPVARIFCLALCCNITTPILYPIFSQKTRKIFAGCPQPRRLRREAAMAQSACSFFRAVPPRRFRLQGGLPHLGFRLPAGLLHQAGRLQGGPTCGSAPPPRPPPPRAHRPAFPETCARLRSHAGARQSPLSAPQTADRDPGAHSRAAPGGSRFPSWRFPPPAASRRRPFPLSIISSVPPLGKTHAGTRNSARCTARRDPPA